tara:strand:- start:25695 stop:26834 length:1140 start_codon:yes stop_codon:yes gene_type:complete
MLKDIYHVIERIHESDVKIVLTVSGAGSKALSWLLEVPGASNTLLEAHVPYSEKSMSSFLGTIPDNFVSNSTSLMMAHAAYKRAISTKPHNSKVIGISCTAAIATSRKRKGENQAFISFWSDLKRNTVHVKFNKEELTRVEEEELISQSIIEFLYEEIFGEGKETIRSKNTSLTKIEFENYLSALTSKQIESIEYFGETPNSSDSSFSGVILSGSFNPIHKGHINLLNLASQITNKPAAFELSAFNVDKPPLSIEEINSRLKQFETTQRILVSNSPLFSQKSKIFPGSTFVIGWDTAERLINPKYYNQNEDIMYNTFQEIEEMSCDFLVAGRLSDGSFRELSALDIPSRFKQIFKSIPESKFRIDISSTQLRLTGLSEK